MIFVTKLVVVANDRSHATNEIFFHYIHIWLPYNVYMSDLAIKITAILMISCIFKCGTHLDLCHMALI
jgi:hypothetical protein